jgi:hypothetical protein
MPKYDPSMRHIKLTKHHAVKWKTIGDLGESLAIDVLTSSGFSRVENLNEDHPNHEFGDILGVRDGKRYVISVKTRNKYEFRKNGQKVLTSRYKLGTKCYQHSETVSRKLDAVPAFLAIPIEPETFSAYFGTLEQLHGNTGIPMSKKALSNYECLAFDTPHNAKYSEILNTY